MSDAPTDYRGMDAAEIDRQYNFRTMVPGHGTVLARWAAESAAARRRLDGRLDLPTGPHPRQRIDLFPAGEKAPLLAFIHGGYWRSLSKDSFSFLAEPFVARGVAVALIGYGLCPDVTFETLVGQVRDGVEWLFARGADHGIDTTRILLSGHSAGGHLTALLASEPGSGLAGGRLAGGLCLSGIYDLESMLLLNVNADLRLDQPTARRLSPQNRVPEGSAPPLVLALGGEESADMHRQQTDYAAAWAARGHAVRGLVEPGADHFTLVDRLADPSSPLFGAALGLLGV